MAYCYVYANQPDYPVNIDNFYLAPDSSTQYPDCAAFMALTVAEYQELTQNNGATEIDSAVLASSFMWGFGAVITVWGLAYAIRIAIAVIRSL